MSSPNATSFGAQWRRFAGEEPWGYDRQARCGILLSELDQPAEWLAGKTFLDVGCGLGLVAGVAADLGATVTAIDVSDSILIAQQNQPNVTFLQADLMEPPFADGSFDIVYSGGVLHHTPDTQAALQRTLRLVAPGGTLCVWLYQPVDSRAHRIKYSLRRGPLRLRQLVAAIFALQAWLTDRGDLRQHWLSQHDFFTPRWRWEHTPDEVLGWLDGLGVNAHVTHSSRDGFAVLAVV